MGADYHAYAVIGIVVDSSKFYHEPRTVKAFDHDYPEDMKFCPQTGKELWALDEEPIEGFDEDRYTLGGFPIVQGTDGKIEVLAVCRNGADDYDRGKVKPLPDNLDELKQQVKSLLEPLGQWDERKWGLYAILYCSY